jgi:5-methylcytosine-specific restriction endonuclease McrA
LKFGRVGLHAALRVYVYVRDNFQCKRCGCRCSSPPAEYDGRLALVTDDNVLLVIDHIVSIRGGGSHHPANLQTLCDPCNARKAVETGRENRVRNSDECRKTAE